MQVPHGLVEGGLGQGDGLFGGIGDLVVEDGEVEGQPQADGVRGLHLLFADVHGLLVGFLGVVYRLLAVVPGGHLGQVSEIVALHLQVEDLALSIARLLDEILVQQGQHVLADPIQLPLHLLPILIHQLRFVIPLFGFVLDAGDDPPRRALAPHHVLVGNGQEVALLVGQLVPVFHHRLHEVCHVLVALSLLGQLGLLHLVVSCHGWDVCAAQTLGQGAGPGGVDNEKEVLFFDLQK